MPVASSPAPGAASASAARLLAVDWGTTSARAYRVDGNGRVLDERSAPLGIQHVQDGRFAEALAKLLGDWSALPLPRLACGMIGSRQGWCEAPYRDCPADLEALARSLVRTTDRALAIVPGLTCRDQAGVPDVMRGEETQVLGALDDLDAPALVVHPGTHGKWCRVGDGGIRDFRTFMTGELYAVAMAHSILGRMARSGADALDASAFRRGVARGLESGASGDLLHRMFGARTLALFDQLAPEGVGDYLSGVLIGSEVAAGHAWLAATHGAGLVPLLVGAPALTERYAIAFELAGNPARLGASDAAARGLYRVARAARLIDGMPA